MSRKSLLKSRILCYLLASSAAFSSVSVAWAANNTISNTQLPDFEHASYNQQNVTITQGSGNSLNISQSSQNAVIQWGGGGFNVGADATVNFKGDNTGYNVLNYDKSGSMSQIYGNINANNNGNVYIVNPSGVQIGNSAQINVGSLHVSNKKLNETSINNFEGNLNAVIDSSFTATAELMSLGNINTNELVLDGSRIVLDVDRVKDAEGDAPLGAADITIKTDAKDKVVLGYTAYDGTYADKDTSEKLANLYVKDKDSEKYTEATYTKADGYMWVKDGEQLQAIKTNADANYALRSSIDLNGVGFTSIIGENGEAFSGKLDGLGNDIFGLSGDNGLFESTNGAEIRNFNLVSGSIESTDGSAIGAVAGTATGTTIENVLNTVDVTGDENVGGLVGSGDNVTLNGVVNLGSVAGSMNVGGIAGSVTGGSLQGESYNLGNVQGNDTESYNIGGLVGSGSNITIGNESGAEIYNHVDIEGGYNVGGIIGSISGTSTVQNVSNDGDINATGSVEENYYAHVGDAAKKVDVANVGGIAGNSDGNIENNSKGVTFTNVENSGNVSSSQQEGKDYYDAGNVGGIVGRAEDTNITDAVNLENDIRGAHNVGGIVGYYGGAGMITSAINDGSDIMATGARYNGNIVTEAVKQDTGNPETNFGNMGGIAGYMYGDGVYITKSANRGTVHSLDITDDANVSQASKASNTGGIVGKIDRSSTASLSDIQNGNKQAAVSDSYNTGEVRGYVGVGGVAGSMYNGEITGSYNLNSVTTTRRAGLTATDYYNVNLGGIVGDTYAREGLSVVLYDVYNKGQIGDENFIYGARHVGGIAGRLNGTVEQAYNNGAIYNGYNVTGGIAGWFISGTINNSFNTGNITVVNKENTTAGSQVGGIAGAAASGATTISNAYNLGTLRSFGNVGGNAIGGIVGKVIDNGQSGPMNIRNVYTMGNIWSDGGNIGAIVGAADSNTSTAIQNAYYIAPEENSGFNTVDYSGATKIAYDDRHNSGSYDFDFGDNGGWRIYNGTTPILNAFMPNSKDYFDKNTVTGITGIQYGTAYDPLLTIIKANQNITLNWEDLGTRNDGSIAVYGGGLNLTDFSTVGESSGYYSGTIYSDGKLDIDGTGDISLSQVSHLYGSSVDLSTDGDIVINGNITATGQSGYGDVDSNGNITISGDEVSIYGQIVSAAAGEETHITGIGDTGRDISYSTSNIGKSSIALPDVGDLYGEEVTSAGAGDITVIATKGDANLYFGHEEKGFISTDGNLKVSAAKGNVFIDSDMAIKGDISATAAKEIVLDISNIGKISLADYTANLSTALGGSVANKTVDEIINKIKEVADVEDEDLLGVFAEYLKENGSSESGDDFDKFLSNAILKVRLHEFLRSFSGDKKIAFSGTDDAKILGDPWDYEKNDFDLDKFDLVTENNKLNTLSAALSKINITIKDKKMDPMKTVYMWISDAEQLNKIQAYKDAKDAANVKTDILNYNFALKNDIDATDITDYNIIARDEGESFNGIFDGRGYAVIGLNAGESGDTNVGIIAVNGGTIRNLKVYSSNFTGSGNVGAVAGINNGTIQNITTIGNEVIAAGTAAGTVPGVGDGTEQGGNVSTIGGIAGYNNGTVADIVARDSIIGKIDNIAIGGVIGYNDKNGKLEDVESHTAISTELAEGETAKALGGVAGINMGGIVNAKAYGVTGTGLSGHMGGIVGGNQGTISGAYNEAIVRGSTDVGGIVGKNNGGTITNVANAGWVNGGTDVGGLVGDNIGSITNGRNSGIINGETYVGGLVGNNDADSELKDLVNDSSASIVGESFVGGIAGKNSGLIAKDQDNLINRGTITGQNYVGGVAGYNDGTIKNVANDVELNIKNADTEEQARYFGGVAGYNAKEGIITNATNYADVTANGAEFVGGIVGHNVGTLEELNGNYGNVTGGSFVGGVVGKNDKAISDVEAENAGTVIAESGNAGGIFGQNTAAITNSSLTNKGIVSGTYSDDDLGTGGIIGVNSGHITKTSLKNEVGGTVIGVKNVGGLIGINTGTITGGRVEDENGLKYYAYKIYNNGVITAGTWKDENNNGVVDDGEITAAAGTNIGGLVGVNGKETINGEEKVGSITAAYNTGAINAAESTNVGGIAGANTGTLDQVFNTIMVADKSQEAAVTGGTYVGGLVGSNSGTVSNAYNSTAVNGNTNAGNAVGTNAGGTVSNVFDVVNGSGSLIGGGTGTVNNSYSIIESDKEKGITVIDAANVKDADEYSDFDSDTWKFYDGYQTPLLKVFLTEAKYNGTIGDFTYNTQNQGINTGNITAADDLAAYNAAQILLQNLLNKNAGDYTIFSQQIAQSGTEEFNPNNLGYDIDVDYTINKAALKVDLGDVERTYGNTTITKGDYDDYDIIMGNNFNESMKDEIEDNLVMNKDSITDDALTGNSEGRVTEDAGDHTWSADFTLGGDLDNNYEITVVDGTSKVNKAKVTINVNDVETTYGTAFDQKDYGYTFVDGSGLVNGDTSIGDVIYSNSAALDGKDGKVTADAGTHKGAVTIDGDINLKNYKVTVNAGDAVVDKANLIINVNNAETTYGTAFDKNDYGYSFEENAGLVNGDGKEIIGDVSYSNSAALDGKDGKVTADAGTHKSAVTIDGDINLKNYKVTVNAGDAVVDKADLVININDESIKVGDVPDYTGTDLDGKLVNGDHISKGGYHYDISSNSEAEDIENEVGDHENRIGIWIGDKYYYYISDSINNLPAGGVFANYDVTINMGDLTVTDDTLPEGLPDKPDSRWDYLYKDAPFDRNKDFRERKAEINFVDGGMEV